MPARGRAGGEITRLEERPKRAMRHVSFMFRLRASGGGSSEPQMTRGYPRTGQRPHVNR